MLYDINPLKIFELNDNFKCKLKINTNDLLLKKLMKLSRFTFPYKNNSTNLINIGKNDFFLL